MFTEGWLPAARFFASIPESGQFGMGVKRMGSHCAFIEEPPVATIFPNRVRLVSRSGDETYTRIFERGVWRRFLEAEIRKLNEYELAERAERKVVGLRGHG